jgi:predicted dehydrogenase
VPPFEIAFVGGSTRSAIGNVHRIASAMEGRFRLVGGCFSRSLEASHETGERWQIEVSRIYSSVDELIASEQGRCVAVVVLTPVFEHSVGIGALLKAGFNVISEKPLVANSREAELVVEQVREAQGRLFTTFNYTGYPMVRELRERIRRGDFGLVKQMRLTMQQESFVKRDASGRPIPPQAWRREDREIPTVSLDLGMHVVHLQQFLVPQRAISVMSRMDSFGHFEEVIDDVDVMYRCDDGLFVNGWWSKSAAGYANGLSVEIFGTEGSARWVQSEPEILQLSDTSGTTRGIHRGTTGCLVASEPRYNRFKAGHPDGFIEAFANLYTDIAIEIDEAKSGIDGSTYASEFSASQSLGLLRLLEASVRSSREGVMVKVGN